MDSADEATARKVDRIHQERYELGVGTRYASSHAGSLFEEGAKENRRSEEARRQLVKEMEGGGDGLGSQHARRREGDEEERRSEDTFFDGLAKSKDAAHEAVEGQHDAKERWLAAVKAHVKEGVERNHRRDMNYW
eukprot:551479-Hanusia_phi.AAC.2